MMKIVMALLVVGHIFGFNSLVNAKEKEIVSTNNSKNSKTGATSICNLKLPIFERGCQGELCDCRPKSPSPSAQDFDIKESAAPNSRIVGHVKKGETVEHEAWIEIVSFGVAKLINSSKEAKSYGLKNGSKVGIYQYLGEGMWKICSGKHIFQEDYESADLNIIKQANIREWYKVKLKNGVSGYAPRLYIDQHAPGCG